MENEKNRRKFYKNHVLDESEYRSLIEIITSSNVASEATVVKSDLYQLTKSSFERLGPGQWLNDEVINAYIALVNKRERGSGAISSFAFNTFFFTQLQDMNRLGAYNFGKLARIVNKQKVKLRNLRQVFIPINLKDHHWLLMYLDMDASTFYVLDSMSAGLAEAEGYVRAVSQFL